MPRFFQPATVAVNEKTMPIRRIFSMRWPSENRMPACHRFGKCRSHCETPTDCWDAQGAMMCWWQGWKSFSKRPRTQNWHWDWMTLASWDFGSIFGSFFWNMRISMCFASLIKVRVFWDLRSCCQPLCVRTLKGSPTALGQLDMWWSLAELMTCRCELIQSKVVVASMHQWE